MFFNKIDYWTKERGLKKKFLAKECGVSEQTFSNWCLNNTQPNLKQSFILAQIFQISMDDIGEFKEE